MQQPYYYGPPQYPQTPYMGQIPPPPTNNPYAPYYSAPNPAPNHNNLPAPAPYSFDAAAYSLKPNATQARRHRRNQTTTAAGSSTPAASSAAPLKSALKKTTTFLNAAESTIGRQFSYPFSTQVHNPQAKISMPRPRVHSNPTNPQQLRESMYEQDARDFREDQVSYHMLVSFHGYNELHIEHPMEKALNDTRELIWPIWKDGIESENIVHDTCIVKFKNSPWDMGGPNVKQTYQLITSFFRLWQNRGYSFQTAVGIASPTPRLIFQVTQPDPYADFFVAYFSQDGRRFTLIEPPNHIDLSIGARLRSVFPRKILDNVVEEYTRVIEVKRKIGSNAPEVESSVLFVEILGVLTQLGFQLDATIPLARRGSLGMRSQRELMVFKGHLPAQ